MPTTIHITDQGNQTISGVKTFGQGISVAGGNVNLIGKHSIGIGYQTGSSIILQGGSGVSNGDAFTSKAIGGSITLIGGPAVSGGFPGNNPGNITLIGGSGFGGGFVPDGSDGNARINLYAGPTYYDPRGGIIVLKGNTYINPDFNRSREFIIFKSGVDALGFAPSNLRVSQNSVNVNNLLTVSGNPVLTGLSTLYATSSNLVLTGSVLDNKINSLSGASVLIFGSQNISGTKTFISSSFFNNNITVGNILTVSGNSNFSGNSNISGSLNVAGAANFRSGIVTVSSNLRVSGDIINDSVVSSKNAQIISGVKTFTNKILLNTYVSSGYDPSNDDYRLNIAGNVEEDASIQLDSYGGAGASSQIMARKARGTATNLSGILKNDVIFNYAAKGYVSGLSGYSQNSRAQLRFTADEDWVARPGYTGQGTFITIRTTNIGSGSTIDKVIIGTSGLSVLDGNIYISGYPVVNTTSDQIISGNKTFASRPTVNGTGFLLSGEASAVTLPNTIVYTTGDQLISGNKTFVNNVNISGTGNFNNVKVSNIDKLYVSGVDVLVTNMDNLFLSGIDIVITGNSSVNVYNAIYISGNPVLTGVIPTAQTISNVVYTTGNQTISGNKTFANSGVFSLSQASPLSLSNNPLSIVGSGNSYLQLNIQNRATGTDASADLVITANNGTDNTNYINLGINNSGYSNSEFTNGSGLDGYLFIDGGNLDIGTKTPGRAIEFHAGGTAAGSTIARISQSGLNIVSGNLTVNNTGVLLTGQNTFTVFMQATNSNPANDSISYFNNIPGGPSTVVANKIFQIGEKCIAKKAAWNQYLDTFTGVPNQNATGYFINVSTRSTGVISTVINANTFGASGFSYVSQITPNIAVNETDYVVCGLKWGNYTVGSRPSGWRAAVNIYCYN